MSTSYERKMIRKKYPKTKCFFRGIAVLLSIFLAFPVSVNNISLQKVSAAAESSYGDIDGDGIVGSTDALEVLRAVVHLLELTNEQTINADVDGNGDVSSIDALYILRYVVYIIDSFPVEDIAIQETFFVDFYADESDVLVGEKKTVTFFAEVDTEFSVLNDAIELYGQNGSQITSMHDDGNNGDLVADDGIYSAQISLESDEQKVEYYYAKYTNLVSTQYPISFYLDLSIEELTAGEGVMDKLCEITSTNTETGDIEADTELALRSYNAVIDYLDTLKQEGAIKEYERQADGIHYTMPSNIEYCFLFENLLTDGDGISVTSFSSNEFYADNTIENFASAVSINSFFDQKESEICVLKPFNWQHPNTNLDNSAQYILNTGLPYSYTSLYENSNVTVELMKKLQDYHIILLDSHGGVNNICTGESPTNKSYRSYSADLQAGLIGIYGVSGDDNDCFYGVSDGFFSKYYRTGSLNNPLIYLGTCHGADETALSNALKKAGAQTILAYNNAVRTSYCEKMCEEIVKNLCKKNPENSFNSVALAVAEAKDTLGCTDYGDNSWWIKLVELFGVKPAEIQILGNSYFTLSSGFIAGRVLDASTGFEIMQGYVRVQNESEKFKEGAFSIRANTGADNSIMISSNGYLKRIVNNVNVNPGTTTYLSDSRLIPASATSTYISGAVQNATSTEPIGGVKLSFRKDHNNTSGDVIVTTYTDAYGNYEISTLPVGYYTMEASAEGYIPQYMDILVGTNDYETVSLSPVLSKESMRIVLTWGENPEDLDSHVQGMLSDGNSFHVYYGYASQYDNDVEVCNLDVDDTTSYGPETITLNPTTDDAYYYYVNKYSGFGTVANSGAQIKIYQGEILIKTFNVPTDLGDSDYWNVFAIKDGELIVRNSISDSADLEYAE